MRTNNPFENREDGVRRSVSQDEYSAFIFQIELLHIWLERSKVDNRFGPNSPELGFINITEKVSWTEIEEGFRSIIHYEVKMRSGESKRSRMLAIFEATFAVDFSSKLPMSEEIFSVFSENNLPLNTWPYLREFIATSLGRMNWMVFTLPALKLGTPLQTRDQKKISAIQTEPTL